MCPDSVPGRAAARVPARAAPIGAATLARAPQLLSPNPAAAKRFLEFFAAQIRNPNTRMAYFRAVSRFAGWCESNGLTELVDLEPVHVAAYVEQLGKRLPPPSVKQHLAAIRMLGDWLVVGQVIATRPAAPMRGPRHVVRKGKTAVLTAEEARTLLDSIPGDTDTVVGMRDRALIALVVYTFAPVGAVIKMRSEDVYVQGRCTRVRLHEKDGKRHEMPCHHSLDTYLAEYIEAAGVADEPKGWLFRSTRARPGELTGNPLSQADVYRMIRCRAFAAGIRTQIGNHTFRAAGITEYLRNGGKLEIAQRMPNHESAHHRPV